MPSSVLHIISPSVSHSLQLLPQSSLSLLDLVIPPSSCSSQSSVSPLRHFLSPTPLSFSNAANTTEEASRCAQLINRHCAVSWMSMVSSIHHVSSRSVSLIASIFILANISTCVIGESAGTPGSIAAFEATCAATGRTAECCELAIVSRAYNMSRGLC